MPGRKLKRALPTTATDREEADSSAFQEAENSNQSAAPSTPPILPQWGDDSEDEDPPLSPLLSSHALLDDEREEEDEGDDLFGENFEDDYRPIPHLDSYSSSQIADDDPSLNVPMSIAERRKVEALLAQRDRNVAAQGMSPEDLLLQGLDPSTEEAQRLHHRFLAAQEATGTSFPDFHSSEAAGAEHQQEIVGLPEEALGEADAAGYSLGDFILVQNFRRRISQDFQRFLHSQPTLVQSVREMCMLNGESFNLSYSLLAQECPFLAKLLVNAPRECLKVFDGAAMLFTLSLFPRYSQIKPEVHVRISDFPLQEQLRSLRFLHLNCLVKVSGVVTRRSGVFPQLHLVKFDCARCGEGIGPFAQEASSCNSSGLQHPSTCPACQSRGPFHVNITQTLYQNFQKLTLQEPPESVPAGRLPRHKEVLLFGDLMDCARPGDRLHVTGVYGNAFSHSLANTLSFPVFSTCIEANHIQLLTNGSFNGGDDNAHSPHHQSSESSSSLTEEDIAQILELSKNPNICSRIFSSVAPFIHGHPEVKRAIALALFGGQPKNWEGKHRIRGDINVLLLGDPGCGKSQFLKWVSKTAPRALYATGQGASAVGLTAAVRKDPVTREWTLEGGALVLADRGVCLIDEFDKMNEKDRVSIHEAMEQQSISISKAGIVTTLQARCSVIAAANPIRGLYNPSLTLAQNVALSDPILTRFDLVCTVRDVVDGEADEQLARFVCGMHAQSGGGSSVTNNPNNPNNEMQQQIGDSSPLSPEVFKKYLNYAKRHIHPRISEVDSDKIARMYAELRQASHAASGSLPITVRHVESIVRIAEARARICLRDWVRGEDLDFGMSALLTSWLGTQKWAVQKSLRRSFSRYLLPATGGSGQSSASSALWEVALWQLGEAVREEERYQALISKGQLAGSLAVKINRREFEARLKAFGGGAASGMMLDLAFYRSAPFLAAGYRLSGDGEAIMQARGGK